MTFLVRVRDRVRVRIRSLRCAHHSNIEFFVCKSSQNPWKNKKKKQLSDFKPVCIAQWPKIGSDPFKPLSNSKFDADSESEISFSKKTIKIQQNPKIPIFFRVFRTEFSSKSDKNFFFKFIRIELTRKNSFEKKFDQVKNCSKFGLFDPTYDH